MAPPSPARGEGVARAPGFTPRGGLAALAASCRPAAARSRRPGAGCARDRCAAFPRSARPPRHARRRVRARSPRESDARRRGRGRGGSAKPTISRSVTTAAPTRPWSAKRSRTVIVKISPASLNRRAASSPVENFRPVALNCVARWNKFVHRPQRRAGSQSFEVTFNFERGEKSLLVLNARAQAFAPQLSLHQCGPRLRLGRERTAVAAGGRSATCGAARTAPRPRPLLPAARGERARARRDDRR
jgi:hypothetical protein